MALKRLSIRAKDVIGLVFWILITFGVASFASQFEPGEWYLTLAKPTWTPPGWLFSLAGRSSSPRCKISRDCGIGGVMTTLSLVNVLSLSTSSSHEVPDHLI